MVLLRRYLIPLSFSLSMAFCSPVDVDNDDLIEKVDFYVASPKSNDESNSARERLYSMVDSSEREMSVILSSLTDRELARKIVAKRSSSYTLRVATDKRSLSTDIGFVELDNNFITVSRNTTGFVSSNFFTFDRVRCFFSTTSPGKFAERISFSMAIQGRDICSDFTNEAVLLADGSLFSDVGTAAFNQFRYSKYLSDPNNRFRIGSLIINVFFGAQERPFARVITEMLKAKKSILFITGPLIHNMVTGNLEQNRSHLLNVIEYKQKIPEFSIQGVIDDELISSTDDCTTSPPTQSSDISLHCHLKNSLGANIKKFVTNSEYPNPINYLMFLLDNGTDFPRLIISTTNFRQTNNFNKTDSVLLIIEPANIGADKKPFEKAKRLIDEIFNEGEEI